jgi:predicted nucleic acid-binding protein
MSSSSTAHCLDANVVVRYLGLSPVAAVDHRWHIWQMEQSRLVAPTLVRYEVVNALHQWVRHRVMTADEAGEVLAEAQSLPIEMHGDEALHERALALAARFSLPAAYDAHYLALAERFGAPLWTTDAQLANAVGDSLPEIRLVG